MTHQSELSDDQKAIYLCNSQQMHKGLILASDQEIQSTVQMEILSGITRLRQICDTPALFMDYAGDSGKIDSLEGICLVKLKNPTIECLSFHNFVAC